jgi:hypothetical protein
LEAHLALESLGPRQRRSGPLISKEGLDKQAIRILYKDG